MTALYDRFVITNAGDSDLSVGDIVSRRQMREVNSALKRQDLKQVEAREAQPAVAQPILLGITQAALSTDSFVSAASFQETTKVLTNAAIKAQVDPLYGLKENVIVGHPIPAGTGQRRFPGCGCRFEDRTRRVAGGAGRRWRWGSGSARYAGQKGGGSGGIGCGSDESACAKGFRSNFSRRSVTPGEISRITE